MSWSWAGTGGKLIAWHMAGSGQRTEVVERQWIGGACPNIACMPSKNEIRSAEVAYLAMFTDPPLAHVGLSEGDAERQGVIVRVARLSLDSVLRAQATGERQGFMKVLVGENDDRILGFTMIGAAAGEVMAVVQMAMLAGAPYARLADAILAHPTMAEGLGMLFLNVPRRSLQQVTPERAA